MSDPIVSVQFSNDFSKEVDEHVKSFSLIKQLPLINLLDIKVLINRDFN